MFKFPPDINTNLINRYNNKIISRVAKTDEVSIEKFLFTKNSNITVSTIIHVFQKEKRHDKTCTFYKDFNSNLYLQFFNLELEECEYVFPRFNCKSFKCLSCNKVHNKNSTQCCSLQNSVIEIISADIKEVVVTTETEAHEYLKKSRDAFIALHFPNLLDTILLR
jgi:hypothetical protein